MNPAILNSQFVQIALPIMITFIAAAWLNGKRIDDLKGDGNRRLDDLRADMNLLRADMNRRFDEVILRLTRIETLLTDHD